MQAGGTSVTSPSAAVTAIGDEVVAWLSGVADTIGASASSICLRTVDGLAVEPVWSIGYPAQVMARWRRIDLSLRSPLTDAVRDDAVVITRSPEDLAARYPELPFTELPGDVARAALRVPGVHGDTLGALVFSFPTAETLDACEAQLVGLAARLGERLMQVDAPFTGLITLSDDMRREHRADDGGLAGIAARLVGAIAPEEVLAVVDDHAEPLLGAARTTIMLLESAGRSLRLVVGPHTPVEAVTHFSSVSIDAPLPGPDTVRSGRPTYLPTRIECDRRYPALRKWSDTAPAIAVVPMRARGKVLGVIAFSWSAAQEFQERQTRQIEQVAAICAAALERAQWYAHERHARLAAERTAVRLQLLQSLIRELSQCATPDEVAAVMASTAMGAVDAEAAAVTLYDGVHAPRRLTSVDVPQTTWSVTGPAFADLTLGHELLTRRLPVVITSRADRDARYPDLRIDDITHEAWVVLPLIMGDRFVGIVAFGWAKARDIDVDEVDFMSTLAVHAAIALDRATLLTAARATAETLQRALLPEIAPIPGWEIASRYVPAVEGTRVGGDWYDVFALPGGRVGLALGDVEGKGVRAAAIMGAVRSALRAYATVNDDPGRVLTELDDYCTAFIGDHMVTLCYAVLDPATGRLTYANAGHPPPLLGGPMGSSWLTEATRPPLGVLRDVARKQASVTLAAPGCSGALLLYSDGLIERRGEPIGNGLEAVRAAAAGLWAVPDLQAGVDDIVKQVEHPHRTIDDMAILAVRRRA